MTEFENLARDKINVFQRRLQFASERCDLLEAYNQVAQADLAVVVKKYVQTNCRKCCWKWGICTICIFTSSPIKRTVMHITEALYERFAPINRRHAALIDNTSQMDKFKFIHRHCLALLQNLDEIPIDVLTDCEESVRARRRLNRKRAEDAALAQKRLAMLAKQLKQRFMPAAVFRRVQIPSILEKRARTGRKTLTTFAAGEKKKDEKKSEWIQMQSDWSIIWDDSVIYHTRMANDLMLEICVDVVQFQQSCGSPLQVICLFPVHFKIFYANYAVNKLT